MDSRAKQRLTGAVILVALFVLFVPELLTGPHKDEPAAGASSDAGMRRYTIDLNSPSTSNQTAPAQASPAASTTAPASTPASAPAPAPAAQTATPVVKPALPIARPDAAAPLASPTQSAPPPATATIKPKPAPAQTPAATPTATPGSFVVQLGSFSSRENADKLVRDMNAKGFHAFVAPIASGGRELYRVRVGPTRDRAAAEALATQLSKAGHAGSSIVPIS